jgi:hypothetical protein
MKGGSAEWQILEEAALRVPHEEDCGILQKDNMKPHQKVKELPESNIDCKLI